jgi:hypothetical protein
MFKKNLFVWCLMITLLSLYPLTTSPQPVVAATHYYVDGATGSDANPGTSWDRAWRTLQRAADIAGPGDVVYVKSGLYAESLHTSRSGTSVAPITFVGLNRPAIACNRQTCIEIDGDYVTLRGFEVRQATGFGILIAGSHVQVIDCYVHHNHDEGIRITNTSDVLIEGGKIYDNGPGNAAGLWLHGTVQHISVDGVEFYSTGLQATAISAWEAAGSSYLTLRNIFVHDHPEYGVTLVTDHFGSMTHVHVTGAHFRHNGTGSVRYLGDFAYRPGNLLMHRIHDSVVERSVFESGQGWGLDSYTSDRVIFRNNLFINNADTMANPVGPGIGLEVNAGADNQVLYNTFYGNAIGLLASHIYAGGPWPPGPASLTARNNIMYNNDENYAEEFEGGYGVSVTRDHNLINVDPRFQNPDYGNFRPRLDSPAIDVGVDLGIYQDLHGFPRPFGGGFDVGAFEYVVFDNHIYLPIILRG